MANRYGEAALVAVRMEMFGKALSAAERWDQAVRKLYPTAPAGQRKGPPRAAFLGLCEAGLVKGVAAEPEASGGASVHRNKRYATQAAALLQAGTHNTVSQLWAELALDSELHANQMDVVLALWKNGLLTPQV